MKKSPWLQYKRTGTAKCISCGETAQTREDALGSYSICKHCGYED